MERVEKVWGHEEIYANDGFCFKRLVINEGWQCSLHHHKIKDELFYLESGKIVLELEGEKFVMLPGDMTRVRPLMWHRFSGLRRSVIIEASTHDDPSDSYRMIGEESRKCME